MADSKYSRQCRTDQVGPKNLAGGKMYPAPKLPKNPQFGNPGKSSQPRPEDSNK